MSIVPRDSLEKKQERREDVARLIQKPTDLAENLLEDLAMAESASGGRMGEIRLSDGRWVRATWNLKLEKLAR
jgi:hypothetical protein